MKCLWQGCDFEDQEDELNSHITRHAEERFCKWDTCKSKGYEWTNKYTFAAHLRKHIGVTPFKCEKCAKTYTRAEPLKLHMKKHEAFKRENEVIIQKINEMKIVLDEYNQKIRNEQKKKDVYLNALRKIKNEIKKEINN